MLISRRELRLVFTAGLGNALASLSGLPFGYYLPLAVLALGGTSYGGSLELGRQRILGSALGALLLLVGYRGLQGLPLPLALALTLAALRLLGGMLGLQVGYKVGSLIVVMGWLVHEGQLAAWIPLRLFWTCCGVVLTLLCLRLFWPSRGLDQWLAGYSELLGGLQRVYGELADRLEPRAAAPEPDPDAAPATDPPRHWPIGLAAQRALRSQLVNLRRLLPSLALELGNNPRRHPAYRLLESFDAAASRLITALGALLRQGDQRSEARLEATLCRAEAELLRCLEQRLVLWRQLLGRNCPSLPLPPPALMALPASWQQMAGSLDDPDLHDASLEELERLASRLMLCRQAHQAMQDAERQWAILVGGSQDGGRLTHQRSSR